MGFPAAEDNRGCNVARETLAGASQIEQAVQPLLTKNGTPADDSTLGSLRNNLALLASANRCVVLHAIVVYWFAQSQHNPT